MKREKLKQYRGFLRSTRGILGENPVTAYGLALPLMVMGTTSLQNAVAISFGVLITTLPVLILAALLGKKLPLPIRMTVYVLTASAILYGGSFVVGHISPIIFDSLGIYYPLIAVNTILLSLAEALPESTSPLSAGAIGLRNSLGFALTACAMALVRELLGSGTVWGKALPFATVKTSGVLMPFFGFILLGLLCAAVRHMDRMIKASFLRQQKKAAPSSAE